MDDEDLVGIFEVAEIAGVTRQAVTNWRNRFDDFPPPLADLRSGPVFRRDQIRRWLRKRRIPLATIISMINLKGGVGKTTTTLALADMLSGHFDKKVLVIDLDPQTNATVSLIGEDRWLKLNQQGFTLAQLFKDALESDQSMRSFDVQKVRQKRVSNVGAVRSVDLLPSSLDLIDVQDHLASMSSGRFYSQVPTDILRRAVKPILDEYDFVLIDCPPNLGIITLNGLRMSSGYVIPTIPDALSTYGIPQIVNRVSTFAESIGEDIEPFGIVVSKYQANSILHRNTLHWLRKQQDYPPVFNTVIPQANQIAAAAATEGRVSTLKQKWGYAGEEVLYTKLAEELLEVVLP